MKAGWRIRVLGLLLLGGCGITNPWRLPEEKYTSAEHNDFGVVYEQAGNLPEARLEYERSVRRDPKNFVAHTNLGNMMLRQGEWEAARVCYEEALRLRPGYVPALTNLANGYLDREYDPGRAFPLLGRALRRERSPQVLVTLAEASQMAGQERRAEKYYGPALRVLKKYPGEEAGLRPEILRRLADLRRPAAESWGQDKGGSAHEKP